MMQRSIASRFTRACHGPSALPPLGPKAGITLASPLAAAAPVHQSCHVCRPQSRSAQSVRRVILTPISAAKGFGVVKKVGKTLDEEKPCPCGSGKSYGECCSKFVTAKAVPATPEELLRSRYTSYFAKNPEYIADTTHPEASEYNGSRASYLSAIKSTQKRMDLVELAILKQEAGRQPEEAFITFTIKFFDKNAKAQGEMITRTEKSRFLKSSGKWLFIDSEFTQ